MKPFASENESLDDFDVASVVADIGAELSPPVNDEVVEPAEPVVVETAPVVAPATPTDPTAPAVVPGQNSVARPLPKAWKKEMAPVWEKLPPEVHEYVHAREADVMRGIQQYQTGYQQWDSLIKPFAPIFEQHRDVNPVQLMQGLMNTHLQLLNPSAPAETKLRLAQKILADYGIELPSSGVPSPSADSAELAALKQELSTIRSHLTSREKAEYDAGVEAQLSTIRAFAADPKNEFFDEVGTDIHRFIAQGVASDLASAYEMACWANPAVREKMLAKQRAVTPPPATPRNPATGKFVNIDAVDSPPPRTRRSGTMDDTINAVIASHTQKH